MKHPTPTIPPLQPLLFWETGVLLFAAGIVAARFPVPALSACAAMAWVDGRTRRPAGCLVLLLFLAAGWWAGLRAEPAAPPLPAWLETSLNARKAVPVQGVVRNVRGLPDRRLRIIMEDVVPIGSDAEPLPGRLALTWRDVPEGPRPLPGQRLAARLKIRPVHGFRNRGTWNSEDYWHRQGAFFQAWAAQDDADVRISKEPSFAAALRERLRLRVLAALESPDFVFSRRLFPAPPHEAGPEAGPFRENPLSAEARTATAVIPALLFGDRYGLETSDMERINAAGLTHSLALSGQHLAVAALGALAVAGLVGLIAPGVFLRFPAYSLVGLLSLPLAAFYLWLGDAPPSLIRAAIMLACACLLRYAADLFPERLHRRAALRPPFAFADILIVALFCMLLNDPLCLYDLGVQLSFTAVAGIALCLPWLRALWLRGPFAVSPLGVLQGKASPARAAGSRLLRLVWLTLGCSVAAQIATLPLVLDAFGQSTLWFPLNLLWLPALGFVVLPLSFLGLAAAALGLGPAASLLLHSADLPCETLLRGLLWMQRHAGMDVFVAPRPHWTALLGFAAIAVTLSLRVNRPRLPLSGKRLLIVGAVFLAVGPLLWVHAFFEPKVGLRVLDVGQGQAVLLEWPRNGRALVDGGGLFSDRFDVGRDVVSPILTANNLPRLDFIALSHPDRDHLKGLLFIASRYAVGAAYTTPPRLPAAPAVPAQSSETARDKASRPLEEAFGSILALRDIPRHTPRSGDVIPLADGLALEVLAPPPGVAPSGNDGLVLRLTGNGRGLALLPGDAEGPYLRNLLRSGVDLSAEVLVLPHHGSSGSLVSELYDAVSPELAVASAGAHNAYRLPARAVREELARRGIPLRITGDEGEIAVYWNTRELRDGNRGFSSSPYQRSSLPDN